MVIWRCDHIVMKHHPNSLLEHPLSNPQNRIYYTTPGMYLDTTPQSRRKEQMGNITDTSNNDEDPL